MPSQAHKIGGMRGFELETSWFRTEHSVVTPHDPTAPRTPDRRERIRSSEELEENLFKLMCSSPVTHSEPSPDHQPTTKVNPLGSTVWENSGSPEIIRNALCTSCDRNAISHTASSQRLLSNFHGNEYGNGIIRRREAGKSGVKVTSVDLASTSSSVLLTGVLLLAALYSGARGDKKSATFGIVLSQQKRHLHIAARSSTPVRGSEENV
ncbi:hypothetical protein Bbelb_127090 [Branchiostoma belcheri]|nr:hypothetical protein Bbelb_127090 [Branchiostoma belcheri]